LSSNFIFVRISSSLKTEPKAGTLIYKGVNLFSKKLLVVGRFTNVFVPHDTPLSISKNLYKVYSPYTYPPMGSSPLVAGVTPPMAII